MTYVSDEELDRLRTVTSRIRSTMAKIIVGKDDVIATVLTVLLAEGHLLLEDVPGVGKTMLAKALGRALSLETQRIQFTPDLLPSDITGVSVFQQQRGAFEFQPGAIFANIVLGDEINRASPKTQAAMLEAMEELQVSIDGHTHLLPAPFMVVATQNPLEMEGTYPLPEAQRDRFMTTIEMGYPVHKAEVAMLDAHGGADPLATIAPVADATTVAEMIEITRRIYVAPELKDYLVDVVDATRRSSELRLGASPRATLQLLRASRAHAAMAGRNYVNPDDVRTLAPLILSHRVMPAASVGSDGTRPIVERLVRQVLVPTGL